MDFSSIHSLFTPSVLFVLLNVVIGTIAVISSRRHHRTSHGGSGGGGGDQQQQQQQQSPIARSSSSNAIERVRSLGLFRFRSWDLPPVNDDHNDLDSSTMDRNQHQQPQQQEHQFRRIQSESDSKKKKKKKDGAGDATMNYKMKKSTSEKVEIVRRPPVAVDEEVDAKADDFINKFRQQLNLQRLDSLLRGTKEMLTAKRN